MEQKNKIVFALLIAMVIVAAVLSSFGLNFVGGGTPEIVLPTPTAEDHEGPHGGDGTEGDGSYLPVEVTTDTVQEVIRTLTRQPSYTRTISLEISDAEGRKHLSTARVWVNNDWTKVELTQQVQPMGKQYTIVGDGTLYRWYGGGSKVVTWAVDDPDRTADLVQRIPRYEDVLELDAAEIVSAGYQEKEGIPCVYVETEVGELGQRERYWISTDLTQGSGLLAFYQAVKGDVVVLDVKASAFTVTSPLDMDFSLPDGTVLYEPEG